jgi:hypothetical protein
MGGLLRRSVPLVGAAAAATGVLVGLGLLAADLFGSKSPPEHRAVTATMPGVPRHGKGSVFSEADQAVAQLPLANIAFTAPQTLQLGDTTQVQLVLSARESIRQLKKRLSEIGVKHGARIRASNRMEAHLAGLHNRTSPAGGPGRHGPGSDGVEVRRDRLGVHRPRRGVDASSRQDVRQDADRTGHAVRARLPLRLWQLAVALARDWSSSGDLALCGLQAKEEHSPA